MNSSNKPFTVDYQAIADVLQRTLTESAASMGVDVKMLGNWVVVAEALTAAPSEGATQATISVISPQLTSAIGVIDTVGMLSSGIEALRQAHARNCDND